MEHSFFARALQLGFCFFDPVGYPHSSLVDLLVLLAKTLLLLVKASFWLGKPRPLFGCWVNFDLSWLNHQI
jgi:hypothetical protein